MRRLPVNSTTIASVGYDPATRELAIEFRHTRDLYLYFDVPPEEYSAFMAAESKGSYLNQVFKPHAYRYWVVRSGKNS